MRVPELAARLDRLPLSRFHRGVLIAIAFAFFFELADLNTFAYAATGLKKYAGMPVGTIADITSASFLGMFIGAAVGGRLADYVGRRRALIWSVLWYSLFSLLNAGTWNAGSMLAARLLTGIGLSAMTVIAITYMSEIMPRAFRGRMQSAAVAIGLIGIPVMAFVARGVVPTGPNGWRFVFGFGAIGALAVVLIARLPESPRWLLGRGRPEEAEATLTTIEERVRAEVGTLPPVTAVPAEPARPDGGRALRLLFRDQLARRTWMLLVVWAFQTLGFYGFTSWVPVLLASHGFGLTKSLTFSALTTIGAVPGALCAWPVSDRYRRKAPCIAVSVLIAAFGLAYGLSFNAVAIIVFGFAVSFFIQMFAALLYAYTPELYPTGLRTSGSGLAYGVGRLANIAGPPIVAAIYGGAGYSWVFVYIAACWAVTAAAIAVLGPRTGDVSLEELEQTAVSGEDRPALGTVTDKELRYGA
jgi:MFS transporter, putative metabolite:H+ symporter